MVPNGYLKAYREAGRQAVIHPVKLVHMMFERALTLLDEAEKGALANDPRQRGENISRVIAILNELNASLDHDRGGEQAAFLAGLYESMIVELPKVSINNDVEVLRRTRRYIGRLKKIWEETAMAEHESGKDAAGKGQARSFCGGGGSENVRVANLSVSI